MEQHKVMSSRRNQVNASSRKPFVYAGLEKQEKEHKCSYPSCTDKVWRDSFCWDHYRDEYYASRT